ncbi:uncharacterized protein TNCV_2059441 [Trichonephila clavipes]|uniref:Uncharacterized protein n=1 Tax=Trichonephila clavipes TaxID=2585209 RepID=A0A8X6R2G8_TRICX|nr:uncharacterized protein TNCV_2059441 [Trichonephila clavipes]
MFRSSGQSDMKPPAFSSQTSLTDASLEAVDRRAPNNSKNWQWIAAGDVSARRLTSAPKAENDSMPSSQQFAARWSTATSVQCRLRQFVDVCCTVDCVQECLYTGSPSRQTIDGCVSSGLMSTEPGKLIGTKLSFQMNHASICGTMKATFVLDAMLLNAALQSVLSNDIGA